MCILAEEVRLAVQAVAKTLYHLYLAVHACSEVGALLAVVASLVVYDGVATRQQLLHTIVGSLKVASAARLVAKRPEHNTWMIAVAQHHTLGAVHISRTPRRYVRNLLIAVALDVCLVHAVESEVVEHIVHLCLTWIVGCANGVDIGTLHHLDVLKHCWHVDGMTIERVYILCVHALEVLALAVDIDKVATTLHLAESVTCREHHLLGIAIELTHDDGIQRRRLRRPCLEVLKVVEANGELA